jgi:hypothetical protein
MLSIIISTSSPRRRGSTDLFPVSTSEGRLMAQRERRTEIAIQKHKKGKKDLHRDIKKTNYY